jgi:serine phosphatase RsbU (regulator of sigma subunit)/anti-sigma regulatory factor (Ser/Thr protein kinase)
MLVRVRTGRETRRAEREARKEARRREREARGAELPRPTAAGEIEAPTVDIAPKDPILVYFQGASGPVDLDKLDMDSPGLEALREAGIKLVVPLVSQGELIGLLNLGARLSEQEYSTDDRKLLENLAAQAAPAVRVAQLVRQQQAEARERQRMEQELQVAKLIQQNFLPKELPQLPGWQVEAYYRPAREVGGDFYDFIELPEGQVGIVVGDVTDKGVPAAMVMAATRSVVRAAATRLVAPGAVLERVNELLQPDMPPNMFVTCLYGVLDPASGRLRFANAGHNLPYLRTGEGVAELRATGMPLGLMPGMTYEENEAVIGGAATILLHSDGLAEAHDPEGNMFGFPRLAGLIEEHPGGPALIDELLSDLDRFTGEGWEQEDDVTLVLLHHTANAAASAGRAEPAERSDESGEDDIRTLAEFDVPSERGNERLAMERVADAIVGMDLPPARLERLKTAVAEATMNAMEHGNGYRSEIPVSIKVLASDATLSVRITDRGGGRPIPEAEVPDLDAKLAGEQSPRGWGLFLIKNMVDDVHVASDDTHHTVELVLNLKGAGHDDEPV